MYPRILLMLVLSSLSFSGTSSQCIIPNDIVANETRLGSAVKSLIEGSSKFGLQLLKTLNNNHQTQQDSKGIFFSPFSIWSALMVAYTGAMGETELEMRNLLGLEDGDKFTTWEAFRNIRNFERVDRPVWPITSHPRESFTQANRIYFQEGTTFKDCMADMLEKEIAFLNFAEQPEESRAVINTWVEEQTHNRIRDLIPADAITHWTKMVIANAVYFKEQWEQQFQREATQKRKFTLSDRSEIYVSMMNTRGRFLYGKSEELQCYGLELPYKGNALSMVILLPRNRYSGVSTLTNSLTVEKMKDLFDDMYPREVRVYLPKIKMEDSFDLTSVLYNLGFKSLFDYRRVNLSGFTGKREFQVDAAQHKAFIEVNEEGTEASAATSIIESRSARPIGPATFIADYPFVYLIKDNLSGVILFLGTVQKPPEYPSASQEQR